VIRLLHAGLTLHSAMCTPQFAELLSAIYLEFHETDYCRTSVLFCTVPFKLEGLI